MTPQRHHSLPVDLPPANRFTVLVIDDTAANRVLLRKVLCASGYHVLEATSGEEAREMLSGGAALPDVIVSDVEMPGLDGIELTRWIRSADDGSLAAMPLVVASGNCDRIIMQEALEAGADVFLTKPFELQDLRREIATLLRSRRQPDTRSAKARFSEANRMSAPVERLG